MTSRVSIGARRTTVQYTITFNKGKQMTTSVKTFPAQNEALDLDGRGIKVTERNFTNISLWAPEGSETRWKADKVSGDISDQRVSVKTRKGLRVARVGDYVIKLEADNFIVVKAEDFAREWVRVK